LQTVGPVKFTPSCIIEAEPEDAEAVEAKKALADASEELKGFAEGVVADYKKSEGYDEMSEEDKKAFDAALEAQQKIEDEWYEKFKTIIGYDTEDCDDNCKAAFESEQLVWAKAVYEVCKVNEKDIACQEAYKLREKEEKVRAGNDNEEAKNFYQKMTGEERDAFKKERVAEIEKEEAAIAAAFLADNVPAEGLLGGFCGKPKEEAGEGEEEVADVKCKNLGHCCGTSTPDDAAFADQKLTQICADKTTLKFENQVGRKYTHVCDIGAAGKLAATAAAAVGLVYSLM